jgi:LacI family transcriptional regulator
VARATVSRVLNDQPNVRAAMREKVMAAVEKLGYRVNVQARNLAGRRGLRIGLVHASDFDSEPNSYFSSALELGATRECIRLGAHLITHVANQSDSSAASEILMRLRDDQCDGVILTPPFADDFSLLRSLEKLGIAAVSIAGGPAAEGVVRTIGIDEFSAGHDIGQHLVELGHRRFGFIKGLAGHVAAEGRYDGFLSALAEAGIQPDAVACERGNFTFRSGLDCAQLLLDGQLSITAIVCANDDMAAGALLAAHKRGLRIPEDVAITGFDDTPVSEIVWPPLTTIHQPLRRMGARAVERLIEIVGEDQGVMPGRDIIGHSLVLRDSSVPLVHASPSD